MALSHWTLGSERYRYAIARTDKLGTDSMAVDSTVYVDAVAESGRNPVSKHQIQPECGE